MSKKKGVSAEEKRIRALEYFHEQKTLFSLKELESQLPKVKGIIQQAVKDLIEELVADGLVEKEKIGSGNYYWSFPVTAALKQQQQAEQASAQAEKLAAALDGLRARKESLEAPRADTTERRALLQQLQALQKESAELDQELSTFADPDAVRKLDAYAKTSRAAANRWTDNVFVVLSFYKNRMSDFDQAAFLKNFGLPDDLDELP